MGQIYAIYKGSEILLLQGQNKVNTNNTQASFQPVELKNMLREDKIKPCLSQEKALSNAKEKKDGYFKGPMAV